MNHIEEKIIQTIDEHRDEIIAFAKMCIRDSAGGGPSGYGTLRWPSPCIFPHWKCDRHSAIQRRDLLLKNNTINNNKDNPKITNKNKKLSYKNKLPGKSKKIEIYGWQA